jgi:hypothetical protein
MPKASRSEGPPAFCDKKRQSGKEKPNTPQAASTPLRPVSAGQGVPGVLDALTGKDLGLLPDVLQFLLIHAPSFPAQAA